MLITRTPLRITLGGGGTDLPSYYEQFGGMVVSAAISKHIYISVNRTFTDDYFLKYSALERVEKPPEIEHPIIREVLTTPRHRAGRRDRQHRRHPVGHRPGLVGLVHRGLLNAVTPFQRDHVSAADLAARPARSRSAGCTARSASRTSTPRPSAASPASTSTPTAASPPSGSPCRPTALHDLQEHLLMFFTGYSRAADEVLEDQNRRSPPRRPGDAGQPAPHQGARSARPGRARARRHRAFADLMHEHWENKRRRSGSMSNPRIDHLYDVGRANSAPRRQAGGRRGRRVPDVLRGRAAPPARSHARGGSRGAALQLRPRRLGRAGPRVAPCSASSSPGVSGRGCGRSPSRSPRHCCPVAGRPFADWQLGWLADAGVDSVVYCIGHLGDQVREHVGDGARWGLDVAYVDEGAELRGTAGALPWRPSRAFSTSGSWCSTATRGSRPTRPTVFRTAEASGLPALMTVFENHDRWDRSNVVYPDGLVRAVREGAGRAARRDGLDRLRPVGAHASTW